MGGIQVLGSSDMTGASQLASKIVTNEFRSRLSMWRLPSEPSAWHCPQKARNSPNRSVVYATFCPPTVDALMPVRSTLGTSGSDERATGQPPLVTEVVGGGV